MMLRIASESKFGEHRELARKLAEGMSDRSTSNTGDPVAAVSPFCLPDVEKENVCIDNLRGKWVYMAFVRVGDPNSLKEIETMAFFRDSLRVHHPEVELVGISCDREFQKMYHFLKNSKRGSRYGWTWLLWAQSSRTNLLTISYSCDSLLSEDFKSLADDGLYLGLRGVDELAQGKVFRFHFVDA